MCAIVDAFAQHQCRRVERHRYYRIPTKNLWTKWCFCWNGRSHMARHREIRRTRKFRAILESHHHRSRAEVVEIAAKLEIDLHHFWENWSNCRFTNHRRQMAGTLVHFPQTGHTPGRVRWVADCTTTKCERSNRIGNLSSSHFLSFNQHSAGIIYVHVTETNRVFVSRFPRSAIRFSSTAVVPLQGTCCERSLAIVGTLEIVFNLQPHVPAPEWRSRMLLLYIRGLTAIKFCHKRCTEPPYHKDPDAEAWFVATAMKKSMSLKNNWKFSNKFGTDAHLHDSEPTLLSWSDACGACGACDACGASEQRPWLRAAGSSWLGTKLSGAACKSSGVRAEKICNHIGERSMRLRGLSKPPSYATAKRFALMFSLDLVTCHSQSKGFLALDHG